MVKARHSSTALRFVLAVVVSAVLGCTSLPAPLLPLSPTPDAPFRATAPVVGGATPIVVPAPARFDLDNGLAVYVVEQRGWPTVSVRYVSRHDANPETGAADLAAATAALLTETPRLRRFGFAWHASASSSSLSADVTREDLSAALEKLGTSLSHPSFDSDDLRLLQTWRGSVALLQTGNAPLRALKNVWRRLLGPDHPYAEEPLDLTVDASRWRIDDVERTVRDTFAPNSSALIVVGDLRQDDIETTIRRAFSDLTPQPILASRKPRAPTRLGNAIDVLNVPWFQVAIAVAMPAPREEAEDAASFAILVEVLAGLQSSRLFQSLRLESGETYGVWSRWDAEAPAVLLIASVDRDSVKEAMNAILTDIDAARSRGPDADELETARTVLLERMAARFETASGTAMMVARSFLRRWPADFSQRFAAAVKRVRKEDVREVARRYLDPSRRAVAMAGSAYLIRLELQWTDLTMRFVAE